MTRHQDPARQRPWHATVHPAVLPGMITRRARDRANLARLGHLRRLSVIARRRSAGICARSAGSAGPPAAPGGRPGGHVHLRYLFASLDAVRGFAGDDYERAVVEDAARQALSHWDERSHT